MDFSLERTANLTSFFYSPKLDRITKESDRQLQCF